MGMNGMNISQITKALLGDLQPADGAKALELRIGQIVRGVLLELMDNQEALVNINGAQVRAKLEADMPVGRSVLLQVQSASLDGQLALKPLADTAEGLPDEGLKDALKAFALTDAKGGFELLRGLKRDGYPIAKETASYFNEAMAQKPPGVDAQSWASAADVAFRRGLKPTETTLASLRQALSGQPLQEGLEELRGALTKWLGDGAAARAGTDAGGAQHAQAQQGGAAGGKSAAELGQRLLQVLSQGAALLAEGEAQLAGEAKPAGQGSPAAGASAGAPASREGGRPAQGAAPAGMAAARPDAAAATNAQAAVAAGSAAPEEGAQAAPRAAGSAAAEAAPRQGAAGAANGGARDVAPPREAAAHEGSAAASRGGAAAGLAAGATDSPRGDSGPAQAAPKGEAAWLGRFLQWLGAGHEHKLAQAADWGAGAAQQAGTADGAAPGPEARHAADTLKSALLALASHEDAPPALREAAQTLANQVTGQQLLLTSDRNVNAPVSHMTLFVPFKNGDGETTATVHVQSRRNRRGQWDSDNCRLLFDLRMRHIGDTVVDVQVVDKIVSLRLLCDHPAMGELLESAKDELGEAMRAAGFQLLSAGVSPLPVWKLGSEAPSAAGSAAAPSAIPAGAYAAKPYRGVDFRA